MNTLFFFTWNGLRFVFLVLAVALPCRSEEPLKNRVTHWFESIEDLEKWRGEFKTADELIASAIKATGSRGGIIKPVASVTLKHWFVLFFEEPGNKLSWYVFPRDPKVIKYFPPVAIRQLRKDFTFIADVDYSKIEDTALVYAFLGCDRNIGSLNTKHSEYRQKTGDRLSLLSEEAEHVSFAFSLTPADKSFETERLTITLPIHK